MNRKALTAAILTALAFRSGIIAPAFRTFIITDGIMEFVEYPYYGYAVA